MDISILKEDLQTYVSYGIAWILYLEHFQKIKWLTFPSGEKKISMTLLFSFLFLLWIPDMKSLDTDLDYLSKAI